MNEVYNRLFFAMPHSLASARRRREAPSFWRQISFKRCFSLRE